MNFKALAGFSPFALLDRISPLPARRLLALDAGARSLKLLLLEAFLGRVRVIRHQVIDLQEEALISSEEINRQLRQSMAELGPYPLCLTLPQHRSFSQIIELPSVGAEEIQKQIEEEAVKLGGMGESLIVFDYARLRPIGKFQNPYWITFCQESEMIEHINRYELAGQVVCASTNPANALLAAWTELHPGTDRTLLVDVGASQTVYALVLENQGVLAGSFPIGSDLWTDAIAASRGLSYGEAENLKRSKDLFSSPAAFLELEESLADWENELKRAVGEWLQDNEELNLKPGGLQVVLTGGAVLQPGLLAHLNSRSGWQFVQWPESMSMPARFAIAYGTALHALGWSKQRASLLPAELRMAWKRHDFIQRLQTANLFLLLVVATVLLFGAWQKARLVNDKREAIKQAENALALNAKKNQLAQELAYSYEFVRPLLQKHQHTLDTLELLRVLQTIRANGNLFFVLFADEQSYLASEPLEGTAEPDLDIFSPQPLLSRGFIAELAFVSEGETMRRQLNQVVETLRESSVVRNVDFLPVDRRKLLVDPKLALPGRHFTLAIEMEPNVFQSRVNARTNTPASTRPSRPALRNGSRGLPPPNATLQREIGPVYQEPAEASEKETLPLEQAANTPGGSP
jgi:Tfp pilus assembly PilM family ATPase